MTRVVAPAVPILMYHSISPSATPAFRRFALDPALFRAHMEHLAGEGYHTLTMGQLADVWRSPGGEAALPAKSVVLTFDDGFTDFYTEALPVLRRYRFAATLYVITGYIGASSRWLEPEGEADRPILTWTQLEEIAGSGIECAAHSETHPQLDDVPPEQLRRELLRPKILLEDRLQRTVRSFAYPFGYYSRRVRDLVEGAGYTSACTVKDLLGGGESPFQVPRLTVNAGTDVAALAQLLDTGRSSVVRSGVAEAKRLVWQAVRRHGPDRITARTASGVPGLLEGHRRS